MSTNSDMFKGRVAVVTGAAGGIGRAISLQLAKGGATVIGFLRTESGLKDISNVLKHDGLVVDVAKHAEMEAALATVEAQFGKIDILVTAAGILQPPPLSIDAVSERQFDRIVDVNFKGTWNAVSLTGARMARRGQGSIVTIASTTGIEAGPLIPYGPTKAAIIEMTKSFAGAWGKSGVRVNCVAPGFTMTPALERGVAFGVLNLENLAKATAFGRLATTEEISEAVCFLAGEKASGITGAVLPVDCGALAAPGFAALERSI